MYRNIYFSLNIDIYKLSFSPCNRKDKYHNNKIDCGILKSLLHAETFIHQTNNRTKKIYLGSTVFFSDHAYLLITFEWIVKIGLLIHAMNGLQRLNYLFMQ